MICIKNKKAKFLYKNEMLSDDKNSNFFFTNKEEVLADEVPIALIYNGISHTVMMASPQDLEDFAIGFSLAENIIQDSREIHAIDIVPTCNGIELHIEITTRRFVALKNLRRTLAGRTGCGICGTEQLQQAVKTLPKLPKTFTIDPTKLNHCLFELKNSQELNRQTGATHAATFFDLDYQMLAIREDIGRHIALDKLLGWHARNDKPKGFIIVTSRASFEMVQKTVICGVEMLIAISAPTSLAVTMAESANLSLVGFARENRATIYSGEERFVW